jgi:6-phosphofructokinase 1
MFFAMNEATGKKRLGIIVGGGPAPGINGVISAVSLEALNQGWEVIGFQEGFRHLVKGDTTKNRLMTVEEAESVALKGGSCLSTARVNPAKSPEDMARVLAAFKTLGIDYLVTIGGDDTAFSGSRVYKEAKGAIRVAHVPKTIDNDLPLPPSVPTFGYETARQIGADIVKNLAEDARTSRRWFLVVSMGRAAGHLALGIAKAATSEIAIIPEEFRNREVSLDLICDTIFGSILKNLSRGRNYGVAVLAEGLVESIGEKGLLAMGEAELGKYGNIVRDEHGHLRIAEIDFGRMIKDQVAKRLKAQGISLTLTEKTIGYELRCADPVAFDAEYTRDLGNAAVRFLTSEESTKYGAIICLANGKSQALEFESMIVPSTGRLQNRRVDVDCEAFHVATRYMTRITKSDLGCEATVTKLAGLTKLTAAEFKNRFDSVTTS